MTPERGVPDPVDSEPAPRRLDYYARHGRVTRFDLRPQDSERLSVIRNSLPADVRSILDVGCGVGLVTRPLAENYFVVGVDVSRDVHRGATEPRVCGLATALPFRTGSFDLVLATQIFEHLTDGDLDAVSREMIRVSRRYVLITTTFRENLREASVPCPACGVVFNAYGHLRTFDAHSLEKTVPGCTVRSARTYCLERTYPPVLVAINQSLLRSWHYELALLCTSCGNDRFPSGRTGLARLSRASNLLARVVPRPRRPTRILMLFEKS